MKIVISLINKISEHFQTERCFKETLYWSDLNKEFLIAALNGDVEIIKKMTEKYPLEKLRYVDAIYNACYHGKVEVLSYLSQLPNSHHLWDQQQYHEEHLIKACANGHLDVIQYLLQSDNIKNKANIHCNEDRCFIELCQMKDTSVIKWLILEYGLQKTQAIDKFMKDTQCINFKKCEKEINDWFLYAKLKNSLHQESQVMEKKMKL